MSALPRVELASVVVWQHIAVHVRLSPCSHDTVRQEPVKRVLEEAAEGR